MRKTFYDKIPTYEELKQLDKNYEYVYMLFDIVGSGYLRLTYNEDYEGKISVDYMEGGYLHALHLPICTKTNICENKFYNLNKVNYNKLIKFIRIVRQAIIEELNKWELIEENNLKIDYKSNLKN